ncbi:unnamed protein product, partial [Didymodactylos carnosus]
MYQGVFWKMLLILPASIGHECASSGQINVTFDDLPPITLNAPLPSSDYSNLIWTNAHYIYRRCLLCPNLGYPILCTSGDYVGWFQGNQMLTIQPELGCTTFTFISVLMIASRRNEVTLIEGYYNNTRLYRQTLSLTKTSKYLFEPGWSNIDKITMVVPGGQNIFDDT